MTIPTGQGIHRRMVYIEIEDGYDFDKVAAAIKADPYLHQTRLMSTSCLRLTMLSTWAMVCTSPARV